jgi:hypothetical protein
VPWHLSFAFCALPPLSVVLRWLGNAVVTYKDDTGTEELAGLRQLSCDLFGMERCRVLVGTLEPGAVWKKPIPVNDMKEVSHADAIRPGRRRLPVTNVQGFTKGMPGQYAVADYASVTGGSVAGIAAGTSGSSHQYSGIIRYPAGSHRHRLVPDLRRRSCECR